MQSFEVSLVVVLEMVVMKSRGRKMEMHIILLPLSDRVLEEKVNPAICNVLFIYCQTRNRNQ